MSDEFNLIESLKSRVAELEKERDELNVDNERLKDHVTYWQSLLRKQREGDY